MTGIHRSLAKPDRTFFLFGARGTGKSTWLKQHFPATQIIDLLDTEIQLQLTACPYELESMIIDRGPAEWVVLDEVQKVPALLDEVHRLIEANRWRFALCGSSARKLKRGGADLLAGRAIIRSMESFTSAELGDTFRVDEVLEWGSLPVVWSATVQEKPDILSAYVETYLREEIREESAVRNYAPFVRFLTIAGQLNGQVLNAQNVARDAMVPRSNVTGYFAILKDTWLAHMLPAYRPGLKVREAAHPKFYWFDAGVARAAAGLLRDPLEKAWHGFALETLIYHELRVYNQVSATHRPLFYYRTASGTEVDFVIETRKRQIGVEPEIIAIEIKHATQWKRQWERTMRDLAAQPGIRVQKMIGVYMGDRPLHYDGVDVLPVADFLARLHAGEIYR